ncbi:PAS domain [Comamonadaceae bacterium]
MQTDAPRADNAVSSSLLAPRDRTPGWLWQWALLVGAVACVSLAISDPRPGQVMVWFANAFGVVALMRLPKRQWPAFLVLVALVLWAAHGGFALVSPNVAVSQAGGLHTAWVAFADVPGYLLGMVLAALWLERLPALEQAGESPTVQAQVLLRGALLPAMASAPLGGLAGMLALRGDWSNMALNWLVGGTIGSVAMLPLVLLLATRGVRSAARGWFQPVHVGMALISLSVVLWSATSLPKPFVVMLAPMVWVAVRSTLLNSLVVNGLIALAMAALIRVGVLLPPPSSIWWGDAVYYISVLATLLPGLFLAVMSEGQRRMTQALADREARALSIYRATPAMLHSIDGSGCIVQVNQLWLDTLGYQEAEVLGRHIADFMTSGSARYARDVVIPQALHDGRCNNVEYQFLTRDGAVRDVLLSAVWEFDADGRPERSLAVLQDVTEKKRLQARSHFAEHDALTGLPNRVLLHDRLKMLCAHHDRHNGLFAVGFLDLDHFKEVNDMYGHDAGDALLQAVARRLQGVLRAEDTVSRLGGDEFVMLLGGLSHSGELSTLVAKIMATFVEPCHLGPGPDGPVVQVAASLGVAIYPGDGTDPQTLLLHADQAMYEAKRSGRNRCAFYRRPA